MLKNAYLLAKIGADTAENERKFAKNLQLPYGSTTVWAIELNDSFVITTFSLIRCDNAFWMKARAWATLQTMGGGASKARSEAKYEVPTSESSPIMDTNLEHGHEPWLTVRLIMKMRETNIC